MGLAVSQVRLLALTTRKADIELQMQVDSKRKQMLTRKSTELAQQYYSRLQNANIQYATSNGYEDVTYNYLMGASANGSITDDFFSQVMTGGDYNIPQKFENRMILTDMYGQVVCNNELAIAAAKAKDTYADQTIANQTVQAIWDIMKSNQNNTTIASVMNKLLSMGKENVINYMETMLKNGGYKNGGIVYTDGSGKYYRDASAAKLGHSDPAKVCECDIISLQPGYCYQVLNMEGKIYDGIAGHFYAGESGFDMQLTKQNAMYIGNLISYFGPIISAAMQNGTTAKVTSAPANGTSEVVVTKDTTNPTLTESNVTSQLTSAGMCGKFVDRNTNTTKYYVKKDASSPPEEVTPEEYYQYFNYAIADNDNMGYVNAMNTEKLQTGFRSGTYQLVMVTDPTKGIYHKNTTLNYFTHMNYVVEKTDSSKREEITAWFNAEQAAISEQETYWDTEIQNLSTELNSVNTEIDSVKTIKSNAIKSVFDWGGK